MADIFGTIFDADALEDAVRNTLQTWMHTYLLEVESQLGMVPDSLARPRSYLVAEEVDRELGDQLPAIIVVSPGLVEQPVLEGGSYYRARWHIAVGIMVESGGADPRDNTKRLLRRYTAAARACVLQNRGVLGANEIQTVDVDATGGTFTLTFSGQTTAAIAWNATAAAVQAALEALSNIAPGDVLVKGGPGPAFWTIEFAGVYTGKDVSQMTSNAAALTGASAKVTHATYLLEDLPEVSDVVWVDESYDRLDFEAGQTLAAGEVVFEFEITHVVNRNGGPAFPAVPAPSLVGSDWPTAATTKVTVTPVPITEEV